MLQNDMGNTRIQDSATGAIMQLSPGFVPVGMKEKGGILYIVSANKEGQSEIGTIPSPIITWDYVPISKEIATSTVALDTSVSDVQIISGKIYAGEEFLAVLNLDVLEDGKSAWNEDVNFYECILHDYDPYESIEEGNLVKDPQKHPLISTVDKKGIYAIKLYSCNATQNQLLPTNTAQVYNIIESYNLQHSNYWFIPQQQLGNNTLNLKYTRLNGDMYKYSSKYNYGTLGIQAVLENGVSDFRIVKRAGGMAEDQGPSYLPYTHAYKNSNDEQEYCTYFSSFSYKSDSSVRVAKLDIKIVNNTLDKNVNISYDRNYWKIDWDDDGDESYRVTSEQVKNIDCLVWDEKDSLKNVKFFTDGDFESFQTRSSNIIANSTSSSEESLPVFTTFKYDDNTFYIQRKVLTQDEYVKGNNTHSSKNADTNREGLFYIEYNTKEEYNSWYTLTVDYYDQMDRQLGTYTLKFNPFYNDYIGDAADMIEAGKPELQNNIVRFNAKRDMQGIWFEATKNPPDEIDSMHNVEGNFTPINFDALNSPSDSQSYLNITEMTAEHFVDQPYVYVDRAYTPIWEVTSIGDGSSWGRDVNVTLTMNDITNTYPNNVLRSIAIDKQWKKAVQVRDNSSQSYTTVSKDEAKVYILGKGDDDDTVKKLSADNQVTHKDGNKVCVSVAYLNLFKETSSISSIFKFPTEIDSLKSMPFELKLNMSGWEEGKNPANYGFGNNQANKQYKINKVELSKGDSFYIHLGFVKKQYQLRYQCNISSKIITHFDHYYTYTDRDTGEEVKILGNVFNKMPIKTNLVCDNNGIPENLMPISKDAKWFSSEVFHQEKYEGDTAPESHSIPVNMYGIEGLSIDEYQYSDPLIGSVTLTPGLYVINCYLYYIKKNPYKKGGPPMSFTITFTRSDGNEFSRNVYDSNPYVFYLDDYYEVSVKKDDITSAIFGVLDFGVYRVDTANNPDIDITRFSETWWLPLDSFNKEYLKDSQGYKKMIVMPLSETYQEKDKQVYDVIFDYIYRPKHAYQINQDLHSKLCVYKVSSEGTPVKAQSTYSCYIPKEQKIRF